MPFLGDTLSVNWAVLHQLTMEEVLAEDKVLEKPSIRPRRRAFVGGSTSSNASGEAPVVQVEMADVHPRRPVPMPRKAVQETNIVQEIVDLTSVESDGSSRDIFFAESRKNTIIQPEVENPQAKVSHPHFFLLSELCGVSN